MTFVLLKRYDHYAIVNDDADFIAGRVYPLNGQEGPYRVTALIILCSATESPRALLRIWMHDEPPIRTNLMDIRTPKKLATAYRGSPIQSSIGARSRTVLRNVLTGNMRPVCCLDLAFRFGPAPGCFWGRADIRC